MPSADKRQRKKENARQAREAREAAVKRRRRMKTGRNVIIAMVLFALVIVLFNVVGGSSSKKAASTTTTTTTTTASAHALPAGCTSTAPPSSKKPTDLKAPALQIDPKKTYTATVQTSCGNVTIALDAKNAPKSVNNFVSLARMGFYDGLKFHRVANDPPVVQGGDPKGDGSGGPGYTTTVELPPDGKYPAGAVAWAKGGNDPDGSAGSQFFIDSGDASSIGSHYGYIGKVTGGMDNVQKMATQAVADNQNGEPAHPLYIEKVTIAET